MAGLGRLIAALAATAAADTHYTSISTGWLYITQPDVLTPSFNDIDGSVEYSGKYHLVSKSSSGSSNTVDVTSSGGAKEFWYVSQHFQVPVPKTGSHLQVEVDYTENGVFLRRDAGNLLKVNSWGVGTQCHRIVSGPDVTPPAVLPRVDIVRSLSEPDIEIRFTRLTNEVGDNYVMNKEGLHMIRGEKKNTLLSDLSSVHLDSGKLLIVPITTEQEEEIKIRPDFGEIVVNGQSYLSQRSGWSPRRRRARRFMSSE